jgi:Tol biopolymer transport system component
VTPERIGPYPIEREVGRGGMGVVYLGRDTRLDRRVAIKVLPDALAADPDRLARFEREARVVASLNHPNIAGIYGIEEANGHRFLALEFVDGETLAQRLARGPLTLDETLDVCRQVAAALEAAHESGVVHRDLKPANIKVTPAGDVKVLDFGLAKSSALGGDSAPDLSNSPTLTHPLTSAGMVLGTAAYMSPEQARGRAVDKRTDIWAFGCLLYECLTGRQAFAGETVSDMIARILQGEPEWNALPAKTPERVRGLLRRCLEKDARRRLRDIGDARMEIEDVLGTRVSGSTIAAAAAAPAAAASRAREWAKLAGVALLAAGLAWFLPRALQRPAVPRPARFEVPQPAGQILSIDGICASLSPDGRMLAFVVFDSAGTARIWTRKIESTVARPLAGTNNLELWMTWSPDSRHLAFASQEKLIRVPVEGGDPEVIGAVKASRGGSWGPNGVMLVAPYSNGAIYRMPAAGGEMKAVTTLDSTRGETAHRFPQFLPDGRHFLFTSLPAREGKFDTWIGSIDSPKRRLLMSEPSGVTFAPPGHVLFARNAKLFAQRYDPGSRRLRGEPVSLGDFATPTTRSGGPVVSASRTGTFAYVTQLLTHQRLAWIDRTGRELAPIPLAPGNWSPGAISPDDRRVALQRIESADVSDIWIVDLERGAATRLTDGPGNKASPIWSPDGSRIAYAFDDNQPQVLKIQSLAGGEPVTLLENDPLFKRFHGWSHDGSDLIVFSRLDPATGWDIWLVPADGGEARPYLRTRFHESSASLSPDGRWMAYDSEESGRSEVYVQSFPTPGNKYQVTTSGGTTFAWSDDGRKLLFGMANDQLHGYEADVLPGPEFRLGPPRIAVTVPRNNRGIVPTHGGQRLLALMPAADDPTPSITVVLDGLPKR